MKRFTFLLFVVFGFTASGQGPYIFSIGILPQNPTTNDEIFLATHVGTGNLGLFLGSTLEVDGNNVSVESCYFEGMLTQPQAYFDTISLGYLSAGTFNLSYTAYLSYDYINCDYQGSSSQDTTFIVDQFVGLDKIDAEEIEVYPNPTITGEMYIKSQSSIKSMVLIDLQGRQIPLEHYRLDDTYLISLQTFSIGLYLLSISFDSGAEIRKRISLM